MFYLLPTLSVATSKRTWNDAFGGGKGKSKKGKTDKGKGKLQHGMQENSLSNFAKQDV